MSATARNVLSGCLTGLVASGIVLVIDRLTPLGTPHRTTVMTGWYFAVWLTVEVVALAYRRLFGARSPARPDDPNA